MATQSTSTSNPNKDYFDSARLDTLQYMLCERIDDLFEALGISLNRSRRMFHGACPVHGGDNVMALNLYPQGDSVAYWRCNTWHCESYFKKTIVGFVRGVLSHQKHGWTQPGQHCLTYHQAVDWCCQFLGHTIHTLEVNYDELSKKKFTANISLLNPFHDENKPILTRDKVRKYLNIPAEYFQHRGWSEFILDRYDVGYYPYKGKVLSNRVAVPIYDEFHRNVIGFTGRSVFERCKKCERFHGGECPTDVEEIAKASKWYNHGFSKESILYNFWFAAQHIKKTGTAILTEGPGETWKLEMSGIHNGVALLGTDLSDKQQILLEMSGAMDVVVLLNNDEAGRKGAEAIKSRLGRCFRLHFPEWSYEDVGAAPLDEIRKVLGQYAS